MVNKPTIAVDIDDVLVPHVEDLITWHNKEYGTNMDLASYHSRDPKDWGSDTIEEAISRVQKFFVTPDFLEARPMAEAVGVLTKLSKGYKLIVITARDDIIESVTRKWLNQHFPELFKEAHFTARFNLEGKSLSKADMGKNAGAQYLIDDTLDNIIEASKTGIAALLFGDYPWNQANGLPDGVTRTKNWQEVLEYFNAEG